MPGAASGVALVLEQSLSLWGGVDPRSGRIVDRHHPQLGHSISHRILLLPSGRGSSAASAALAEMIRLRTAPSGIVLGRTDEILMVGALVGTELYGIACPVAVISDESQRQLISSGSFITMHPDGRLLVQQDEHQ